MYILMQVYFNIGRIKMNVARNADTWLKTPCECSVGTGVCIAWIRGSALNKETSATFSHSEFLFHSGAVGNTALWF